MDYVVVGIAAILVTILISIWLRRTRRSYIAVRRQRRAARGETNAEPLLTLAGYRIEERQPQILWSITCAQVRHDISLRADYVVTRNDRRYVAEVKTGDKAPKVANAATRRQLLEYVVAYEVDGVLLVDVERNVVSEVDFHLERLRDEEASLYSGEERHAIRDSYS